MEDKKLLAGTIFFKEGCYDDHPMVFSEEIDGDLSWVAYKTDKGAIVSIPIINILKIEWSSK